MPRRTLAAVLLAVLAAAACIDVPDSMRAQFAPAGPNDRSNYRPGTHGSALPLVEAPPAVGVDAAAPDAAPAPQAQPAPSLDLDAGAPPEGGSV